jgi:hypothetical protein
VSAPKESSEWRSARLRLARGYAPLTVLVLAFALITALVPSVSRDENRTVVTERAAAEGVSTPDGATTPAGGTTPAAGAGSGATSGQGTSSGVQTGGASSSSTATSTPGAARSGGGAAVTGDTTACAGQAEQVPGDPYSPPCIQFSGNNGGATYNGVTGSTITLAYRFASDFAATNEGADSLGGSAYTATQQQTENTINGLVTYFNNHFQFYGRKLKMVYFNGQSAALDEAQGEDQAQAAADATTVAQSLHAFGDASVITQVYAQALTQQHEMNFGIQYLNQADMAAMAPYAWGAGTDCTVDMQRVMNFVDNELANKPAAYAGGNLANQPRKFALITASNPTLQACANEALAQAKAAGVTIADDIPYALNVNTITAQDDNIVAKLANDGITSVILLTDPGSPLFLSERAAQQNYFPEWIESGAADVDYDENAQLYDQSEWSRAFGISFLGPTLPEQATLGYAAYKSVASDEPAPLVAFQMYELLDIISIGLQMAGPDLTPANFEAGMRAYPGSQAGAANAQYGTWAWPNNDFNPVQDSDFVYWNPNKISAFNGQQGGYVVASPRYGAGQYPVGNPPLPSGFPFTPSNNSG